MTPAALRARITEAVAGGFRGSAIEMAARLKVDVEDVYIARGRGATWVIGGDPKGRIYFCWTVIEVAPKLNGQTRWKVQCVCGAEVTRYAADIVAGRSKKCPLPREEHALLIERRRARSVTCPTCGKARACDFGPVDPNGPRGVTVEHGVHPARARLAGCTPLDLPDEGVPRWSSSGEDGAAARLTDVRRGLLTVLRRRAADGG